MIEEFDEAKLVKREIAEPLSRRVQGFLTDMQGSFDPHQRRVLKAVLVPMADAIDRIEAELGIAKPELDTGSPSKFLDSVRAGAKVSRIKG